MIDSTGVLADVGRMNIWNDADGIYERPGLIEGMMVQEIGVLTLLVTRMGMGN
jgi:hypothetical protein